MGGGASSQAKEEIKREPSKEIIILSNTPKGETIKAFIAANFNGVKINRVGNWKWWEGDKHLWDWDTRPLAEGEDPKNKKTERYLKATMHMGTFPTAFDAQNPSTTAVSESNTILRLIGRLGNSTYPLIPEDPWTTAKVEAWMDRGMQFQGMSLNWIMTMWGFPDFGEWHQGFCLQNFGGMLAATDKQLSENTFLLGENLTLADISLFIDFYNWELYGVPVCADQCKNHPNINRWIRQLEKMPEFAKEMTAFDGFRDWLKDTFKPHILPHLLKAFGMG